MIETTKYSPLKLYTDATYRPKEPGEPATISAVYKNHNGLVVGKFGSKVGHQPTSLAAEMEAVIRGISHVSHIPQIDHLKVFTDAKAVLDQLSYEDKNEYSNHVGRITHLYDSFATLDIDWVPRSENSAADVLADTIHDMSVGHWSHFNGRWDG